MPWRPGEISCARLDLRCWMLGCHRASGFQFLLEERNTCRALAYLLEARTYHGPKAKMEESRYLDYVDFDVQFRKHGNGYRADIIEAPGGRAQHAFHSPFQEHELENYVLKMKLCRSGMRKADSPENRAAREFGQKLFDTVFHGELETVFRESVEAARKRGKGLRVRLLLEETPDLADWPWEYLYQHQRR